ncbi:serine/threonine-protein kinase BLUS1-like [Typha latifolia]|uniref:serine/threonine-protein kinase BLUS1-like n=1 Tax=Typha latifolia TaxID=4733 RepID=UPI003C2AB59B
MERKKYPIRAEDYEVYEIVGQGVSASVYQALCIPFDEIVAIKILDLEKTSSDLSRITREAQTMTLIDHPNVLKAHCSFVSRHSLFVVMPYMAGGSCLHIMKSAYPNGFGEVMIATVLREVLKGLVYLHHHGHIHRDVKAGNILVDAQGGVKLGDFGVSACLFDSGDRQRTRNTFVGTPCWMAPEVMEQKHGYDFKADIWSFGITALELAHGHAPFSKYPPMKVLLMTLQNAPPGLDYERDKKFSGYFKQIIGMCLVKDPSKRPCAQKLLKHPFFKQARSQEFINRKILEGLPTLGDQYQVLKEKEEDMLAQEKMLDGEKQEISQNEYKRGISSWNFDIEDLKSQASLIPDNEDIIPSKCSDGCPSSLLEIEILQERVQVSPPFASSCTLQYEGNLEYDVAAQNKSTPLSSPEQTTCFLSLKQQENQDDISKCKGAPCHMLDDASIAAVSRASKSTALNVDEVDGKSKTPVVQQKGRFKVTSGNVDLDKALPSVGLPKSHSMQVISQLPTISLSSVDATSNLLGCSIYPQLHSILQANLLQRDTILRLMKQLSVGDLSPASSASVNRSIEVSRPVPGVVNGKSLLEAALEREKELLQNITDLQWRLICAQDEIQRLEARNAGVGTSDPKFA